MESRIKVWETPDRMDAAFDDPGTSLISIRFCEMEMNQKKEDGKRRYSVVIRYPELTNPIPKGTVFKSWVGVVNSINRRINTRRW